MARRYSFLRAVGVLVAFGYASGPRPRSFLSPDERAVMATVLPPAADSGARDTLLVASQTLPVDTSLVASVDSASILRAGTLNDLELQNQVSLPLGAGSLGLRRIRTATTDSVFRLQRSRLFGPSVITLSRVGFSADKQQALVHAWFGCGLDCGYAEFIVLEKTSTGWVIRARYQSIII